MKKFKLTLPLVMLSLLVGCATSSTTKKPVPVPGVIMATPVAYSPVPPPSPLPGPPPLPANNQLTPVKVASKVLKPMVATRNASGFFIISNPAPSVTLAWDPSTNPIVVKYTIYFGVASGAYTNNSTVVSNGPPCTITNVSLTLPARGVTYYFAATAIDTHGLESVFSNEVSYSVPVIPDAPSLHPVIILIVETENSLGDPWVDAGLPQYAVDPNAPNQFFRLRIVSGQ